MNVYAKCLLCVRAPPSERKSATNELLSFFYKDSQHLFPFTLGSYCLTCFSFSETTLIKIGSESESIQLRMVSCLSFSVTRSNECQIIMSLIILWELLQFTWLNKLWWFRHITFGWNASVVAYSSIRKISVIVQLKFRRIQ